MDTIRTLLDSATDDALAELAALGLVTVGDADGEPTYTLATA